MQFGLSLVAATTAAFSQTRSWFRGSSRRSTKLWCGDRWSVLETDPLSSSVGSVVYVEDAPLDDIPSVVADALGSSVERGHALTEIGAVWYRDDGRWRRYWPSTSSPPSCASLRVYTRPRRFREACDVDWTGRLLYSDAAYVVVDKPPGLPTQADNGNAAECVSSCASRGLGYEFLRSAHRLDSVVGGCCVMATNKKALQAFQGWMRKRRVYKEYSAFSERRPPVGPLVHDMLVPSAKDDRDRFNDIYGPGPRLLRDDADDRGFSPEAWRQCRLEVLSVKKCKGGGGGFESRIRLVTGRPHQIRAQLAAVGAPLVRDTLYAEARSSEQLLFSVDERSCATAPTEPIGLSSRAISFAGRDVKAVIPPWWRH